jgi:hypothetical protein
MPLVPTDVPSSRIAARTAVRPISEDTVAPFFACHQAFEILTIYSPQALETPLRQFPFCVIHASFANPKGVLSLRARWLTVAAVFRMSLDHE